MSSWHLRTPHFEHLQRFQNLIDLHQISLRWAEHFNIPLSSHHPGIQSHPAIGPDAWMLDLIIHPHFESLLIESYPDDILNRLQRLILIVQGGLIESILSINTIPQDSTLTTLEQESWRAGKECGERRWKDLLRDKRKLPLTEVALAFYDSPLSNYPHSDPFLIERSTHEQVWITRQNCPHTCEYPELKPSSDLLCSLQMHWMRGFGFALNPSLQIEVSHPLKSCTQRWHIHESQE